MALDSWVLKLIATFPALVTCLATLPLRADTSLSELKSLYKDAVIYLAVEYQTAADKGCESGSGFIISSSGYILTSYHLLTDELNKKYEKLDIAGSVGESFECGRPRGIVSDVDIVATFPEQDVALLRFKSGKTYDYVRACQQTTVEDGEDLLILGFPLSQPLSPTRAVKGNALGPGGLWQINAAINKGNSGGPVFNKFGRLIGLVYGNVRQADDFSYMVPFDHFKHSFGFAGANLEPCETATGSPVQESCVPLIREHEVKHTLEEHKGFKSFTKGVGNTFAADAGYVIKSFEWKPSSVNNAAGVDIELDPSRTALRFRTQLTSGPIFDRWRGWILGNVVTTQLPANCVGAN